MVKVVMVKNFDKKEYQEWLKKENKMENKISMVEFLATVKNNDEAKKCLEAIKSGKAGEENISVKSVEVEHTDDFVVDENFVRNFKKMFYAMTRMFSDMPDDKIKTLFEDFNDDQMKVLAETSLRMNMNEYKDICMNILKLIETGKLATDIAKIICGCKNNKEKEGEK